MSYPLRQNSGLPEEEMPVGIITRAYSILPRHITDEGDLTRQTEKFWRRLGKELGADYYTFTTRQGHRQMGCRATRSVIDCFYVEEADILSRITDFSDLYKERVDHPHEDLVSFGLWVEWQGKKYAVSRDPECKDAVLLRNL
ncbi:hypothetical protein [Paenibacillus rhizophilus]|uniref:Uncharacterized protein n=1 Tax=Paenibacillus rhizophilus TaxID=1850366 RepID=A0A3N9PRA4_9BACL|nr:hypothetical protein [Paenibacillus rhizophilus]RQW08842.1 hypothetical protein EH198_20840 [Paenibacillus rhizophilus]